MDPRAHFADPASLQLALMTGLVEEPRPTWEPDSAIWMIQAHPRQGGALWVLAQEGRPTGFPSRDRAQEAADRLRGGK